MLSWKLCKFNEVTKAELRKMKLISNRMTNEKLVGFDAHDVVLVKFDGLVVAYCFVSLFSPESHFINEKSAVYLYNYICYDKYKEHKASVFLMNTLKKQYEAFDLNLDVDVENAHARAFFERNDFVCVGKYKARDHKYDSFTYRPSVVDEIDEVKN